MIKKIFLISTLFLLPNFLHADLGGDDLRRYLTHGEASTLIVLAVHPLITSPMNDGTYFKPLTVFCIETGFSFSAEVVYQVAFHDQIYWDRVLIGTGLGMIVSAQLDFELGNSLWPTGKYKLKVK